MTTETQPKARLAAGGLLLASSLALGGCFFGGVDDPTTSSTTTGGTTTTTPATVPTSAQSLANFFTFLRDLASDETSEPLALGDFSPEVSETAEAQSL